MQYIGNHIVPQWAPHWRQLGSELQVDDDLMEIIEKDHSNNCQRCCFMMLEEWIHRNPSASLEDLIVATDRLSSRGMVTTLRIVCLSTVILSVSIKLCIPA